jgi:hypothetical protein
MEPRYDEPDGRVIFYLCLDQLDLPTWGCRRAMAADRIRRSAAVARFFGTQRIQVPAATSEFLRRYLGRDRKENVMKKTAVILATVAALGAAAVTTAPAEARGRGWGPGPAIGLGLAAGALAAGAYGAYGPGYGYGYYGPRYYRPHYYGYGYGYRPRYAYYGPRYYRGW